VHVITRNETTTSKSFGQAGSIRQSRGSSTITGILMFQRLGIEVQQVSGDITGGGSATQGEFDAIVRVVNSRSATCRDPPNSGLHMIPVPYSKKFTDLYALAEFTAPTTRIWSRQATASTPSPFRLCSPLTIGQEHRSLSPGRALRAAAVANFDKLQKPPYHAKWKDVNLAASIPGWTRFSVAETELQQLKRSRNISESPDLEQEFRVFVATCLRAKALRQAARIRRPCSRNSCSGESAKERRADKEIESRASRRYAAARALDVSHIYRSQTGSNLADRSRSLLRLTSFTTNRRTRPASLDRYDPISASRPEPQVLRGFVESRIQPVHDIGRMLSAPHAIPGRELQPGIPASDATGMSGASAMRLAR